MQEKLIPVASHLKGHQASLQGVRGGDSSLNGKEHENFTIKILEDSEKFKIFPSKNPIFPSKNPNFSKKIL